MDTQTNRTSRRRRRRKPRDKKPAVKVEPVVVAARRPDSPRLEKPTRRMKAASAKPRREELAEVQDLQKVQAVDAPQRRRQARIVVHKEDEIDEAEKSRRRLLGRLLTSEGRAAVSKATEDYVSAGFALPRDQEVQLKLLEHFDEKRSQAALDVLTDLLDEEEPIQLPVFRQRLRRLEDYAEDETLRGQAAALRRKLPA